MTGSKEDRMAASEIRRLRPIAHWTLWLAALVGIQMAATTPLHAQQDAEEGQIEAEADKNQVAVLAQFTTGVENREPVDQVSFVESGVKRIFFFSDLRGLAGRTVQHRWIYNGKTIAEVNFEVRGPRWRVWSSKELLPDWIGDWTVEIVALDSGDDHSDDREEGEDEGGEVIAAETFTYSAPDA